jgi:hypothetical protein
MTRHTAFIGLLALGLVAQNLLHYARYKRQRHEQKRALHDWETEGGAVPTGGPGRPRRSPPSRSRSRYRSFGRAARPRALDAFTLRR